MPKLLKAKPERKRLPRHKPSHHEQVAEAAYFLAERRGFSPGRELDDWFAAENMIDAGAAAGAKG